MTGLSDSDWQALAADWQAEGAAPSLSVAVLLRRERRRRVLMALLVMTEILISVAALVWSLIAIRSLPATAGSLVVMAVALYLVMVWVFTLWNRRGTWHPLAESVEGYLSISMLRCQRGLVSARFGFVVACVQLGATLTWVAFLLLRSSPPADRSRLFLALSPSLVIGLAFLIWASWYRRLMERKLIWLKQQLADTALTPAPR